MILVPEISLHGLFAPTVPAYLYKPFSSQPLMLVDDWYGFSVSGATLHF